MTAAPNSGSYWFSLGRAVLVLAVLVAAILGVCWMWPRDVNEVEIGDASKPAVCNLRIASEHAEPTGISVWVSGEINGEADLWAGNWKPERLRGKVNVEIYHDWFQRDCELHYEPIDVISGKLAIQYEFH